MKGVTSRPAHAGTSAACRAAHECGGAGESGGRGQGEGGGQQVCECGNAWGCGTVAEFGKQVGTVTVGSPLPNSATLQAAAAQLPPTLNQVMNALGTT